MKALALSSRPVFVVCDKEKVQIMSGKRIIKMERRFGFSPFLKSGNFRRVGKLFKIFFHFLQQKIKSLKQGDSRRLGIFGYSKKNMHPKGLVKNLARILTHTQKPLHQAQAKMCILGPGIIGCKCNSGWEFFRKSFVFAKQKYYGKNSFFQLQRRLHEAH